MNVDFYKIYTSRMPEVKKNIYFMISRNGLDFHKLAY